MTSLVTDPTNSMIVYAGSAGGGVWKSADEGATWQPLTDSQATLAIGALAIDKTGQVLYAGTGEANGSDSLAGQGILKSTDGGATWALLGRTVFGGHHIGAIVVYRSPGYGSLPDGAVLVASDVGLYQSLDGGLTWSKIGLPGITAIQGRPSPSGAVSQVIEGVGGNLFAVASDVCATEAGDIFRFNPGASASWENVDAFPNAPVASRIDVGAAGGSIVYDALADCNGNLGALEMNTNFGDPAAWTSIWTQGQSEPAPSGLINYFNADPALSPTTAGQGDYDTMIAVDPTNNQQVILGGVTLLAMSVGGSVTFADIGQVYSTGVVHPDFHAAAYTGAQSFYAATDGGIWKTADSGGAGTATPGGTAHWTNLNFTLGTVQFYQGAALDSGHLIGGAQDNGSAGNFSGGATPAWPEYWTSDGSYTAIDPSPGSTTIYTEGAFGGIVRGSSATPYAITPADPCNGLQDAACSEPTSFTPPFAIDFQNPQNAQYIVAASSHVWVSSTGGVPAGSTANGGSWNAISGDLTTGNAISSRGDWIASLTMPKASGPILTGSFYGRLMRDGNGIFSPSWVNATGNLPAFPGFSAAGGAPIAVFPNAWFSGIAVNPQNGSETWVSIGGLNTGHIWHTTDASQGSATRWADLSGSGPGALPNLVANAVVVDPAGQSLYVATDDGVYVCDTCTGALPVANWALMGGGLPNVKVNALSFTADGATLIAWTHGRGAWSVAASHARVTPPVWGSWDRIGGVLAGRPTAVHRTDGGGNVIPGSVDVFMRGTDGAVWHNAGGASWESLGGQPASDLAAVDSGARLWVFARFTDGALWADSIASNSPHPASWSGWSRLGGQLSGEPAATSSAVGQVDVFVRGTDNQLWRDAFNGIAWQWSGVGGQLAASPAAASPASGESIAVVEGADLGLWTWSSKAGWAAGLGGKLAAGPAAVSWGSGRLDVFVKGTDSALWHWSSSTGWEGLGGRLAGRADAVTWGSPRLDVFVQGTDNGLWHAVSNGAAWQWEGLGGQLSQTPAPTSWGVNRLDLFVRGSDLGLWHRAFD